MLLPERVPWVLVALTLDEPQENGFAGGPNQLILQVGGACKEACSLQPASIEVWTVTGLLERRSDDTLFAFVV